VLIGSNRAARIVWLGLVLVAAGCSKSCADAKQQAVPVAAAAPRTATADVKSGASKHELSCEWCRINWCRADTNNGYDLFNVCYGNAAPDPKVVGQPDANFAKDCQAVMECSFEHDCAYSPIMGPSHCYCGSKELDDCVNTGPADDAPCVKEWQAAARTTDNTLILERMSELEYPSGWAFHLIECDRERCGARSPYGRCTP
jgi:hypothetical protein